MNLIISKSELQFSGGLKTTGFRNVFFFVGVSSIGLHSSGTNVEIGLLGIETELPGTSTLS